MPNKKEIEDIKTSLDYQIKKINLPSGFTKSGYNEVTYEGIEYDPEDNVFMVIMNYPPLDIYNEDKLKNLTGKIKKILGLYKKKFPDYKFGYTEDRDLSPNII